MKRIHLNNAGASIVSKETLRVQIDYLRKENSIGGYEAAAEEVDAISNFYPTVAKLLNCDKSEIAFVDSATRAWNSIVYSVPFEKGDTIITTLQEFGSNVVSLTHLSELYGLNLIVLNLDKKGQIDISDLENNLSSNVKLVAVSHAPAHSGNVLNVEEIGIATENHNCLFLVDACQTVGQMSIDVEKIKCDALISTGRKWLRGPRGTGFMYVSKRVSKNLNSVCVDLANTDWLSTPKGGSDIEIYKTAKRFEIWERSYAGQLALTNAIKEFLMLDVTKEVHDVIVSYKNLITASIRKNPNLTLYQEGNPLSGVVTFYCEQQSASDIKDHFGRNSINVSVIHDWDAPWDFAKQKLPPLVRISPHYTNSHQDIAEAVNVIASL